MPGRPKGGSVNQTLPSERHTTSFGLFRRRPWKAAAITVVSPCGLTLNTRRLPCWQITSLPSGSKASPFEPGCGKRPMSVPV